MSLVVNHNMMASNVARNLNAHYGRLATSTERLSTGMRVNSAADDAAGLAIRELMRADIASLQQGARNANDAISMIQTADGALGVIDEKLVRMKELAEQAATGTYDSTQRLMIESEYQAMAKEITRIAYATDFNGIHLLDGSLQGDHDGSGLSATGKMKIHFGTGNDSAEDYYYVEIGESTAAAFGVGMDSTWEDAVNRLVKTFSSNLKNSLENLSLTDATLQEAVENASKNWVSEFENGLKELSQFSNADDLQKLYTAFKYDSEVSKISSLFEKSIANYAGITDRERQKMEYALGRAAMRALAENNSVMTGFGDKVNTYPITDSTEGMLSSNTNSAFSRSDDGSVINYNSTYKLVFIPPNDYSAAKYNAETGEYAPSLYPLSFTTPILTSQIPINNVVTNGTEQFTFNFDGSLLSYSDGNGEVTTYKDARIDSVSDGTNIQVYSSLTDPASGQLQSKYIDTNGVTYYIEDANNNTPDYFYDQSTNIGSKTYFDGTAAANPIKYENNTNNTITLISGTDPTTHIDATGGVTSFYSGGSSFESYIDTYGNTTNFDANGNLTDYTDTSGNITQFDSSTSNNITSYYNATEGSTSTYDTNGALTSYTARDGSRVDYNTTTSTYTVYDSDTRIVDPGSGAYESILQNAITKGNLDYTSAQAAKANALAAQTAATTAQTDAGNNITNAGTDQTTVTGLSWSLTPTSYASALQKTSSVSASNSQIQSVYDAIANTLTSSLTVTANAAETYDYAGFTIATQEDAQEALTSLNKAIEVKDKIRADLGALQNRFENTITNLNTQAENLQAAESRISDTDVSTEMTQFVRNQILTQSAVAMLAQANSLPQMAMQLIGG